MNASLAMIQNMGPWQIILILAIVLLLFGSKKLPDLARSVGKSINEFKQGKEEGARQNPELDDTAKEAARVAEEAKKESV